MGKITKKIIQETYEIAKQVFQEKISLKEGIKILEKIGMNKNTASDYIYNYLNLIQGKTFTRTTNADATEYYLEKIHQENGKKGLEKALLALSQHFDYYEDKTGSKVKTRKDIYNKYLKLIDDKTDNISYPDEVDSAKNYLEGKVKTTLVNSYERNPVARKKCIEHYGLNCQVCEFNFKEKFGEIGENFIHVHHRIEISSIKKEYSIDPIKDLIPVCPNCHSMIHKRNPAYSIEEIKEILKSKVYG